MSHAESQLPSASKISMRHLYLYTHLLIAEANKRGRKVRIVWANIKTASIGPDPTVKNGLLMTLPKMASLGTEEDLQLIEGLIAHEIACHGLHTDFSVPLKPGVAGTLLNILEDPRGELLARPKYPGANSKIHKALTILTKKGIFHSPDPKKETPPSILTGWLVTELRSEELNQTCLHGFSTEYRALAIATFGSDLVDKVKAIAIRGCHATDTQGASNAADEIVTLLKLAKDERSNSKAGDENQQSANGSQSDSSGDQSKPTAGSENQQHSDGDWSNSPNDQSKSTGGSDTQQTGNTGRGDSSKISDAIDKVLNANKADFGDFAKGLEDVISENLPGVTRKWGGGYQPDNSNEMQEQRLSKAGGSFENRKQLRAGAQKTAAMLAVTFEDLIETITQSEVKTTDEGRLNTRKLWRYAVGDDQVFTKRREGESIDTCFYLLGDESISMGSQFGPEPEEGLEDNRITAHDACKRVSVAVGEVLNNVSIPVGIATYNTVVREWHGFDDSWASTLQRYCPVPKSGTKTHLAVVWALKKLIDRQEARKILVVITDGDPGDSEILKSAIEESAGMGIEVRFVLIGDSYHKHYLDAGMVCGVAKTDNDLASAVFGALKQGIV